VVTKIIKYRQEGEEVQKRIRKIRYNICNVSLCSNAVSNSNNITLNKGLTVNDVIKRMSKEAYMAEFIVLSQHFPGGTAETTKKDKKKKKAHT
jgi:hypothetical protein